MKGIYVALKFMTLTLTLSACGYPTGPLEFSERVVGAQSKEASTELLERVQKDLLAPRCSGCHGWAGSLETLLSRITPGEPTLSNVYLRIEDGSMPPFGASFTNEELERVAAAIRALKE